MRSVAGELKQAPIIPEDIGEQTVVTLAPIASERVRQKRGGLHGPLHLDVSEPVQTNVSSVDVAI